jgi:hypothetical protein
MIRFFYWVSFLIVCSVSTLGCSKAVSSHKVIEDVVSGKYITPGNELEDDLLYLKRNGRFIFFRKNVLVPIARIGSYEGTYKLKQDTIIFDWGKIEPSEIRDWLSHQCIVDSQAKTIHFLDDLSLLTAKTMVRKR